MEKPPEPSADDLVAANEFRERMVPRADGTSPAGPFPMWYGWVIVDAFLAGIRWEKARTERES
jgi:hypothetical protein